MTKGKHHDRDVWAPPTPINDAANAAPPQLSKFQQHFQDRMTRLGKDDANVLAGASSIAAASTATTQANDNKGRAPPPTAGAKVRRAAKQSPQRNAFVTPDQVRSQKKAEIVNAQQQQVRKVGPVMETRPADSPSAPQLVKSAGDAWSAPPVTMTTDNSATQAPPVVLPRATNVPPISAQDVNAFLDGLRQQSEATATQAAQAPQPSPPSRMSAEPSPDTHTPQKAPTRRPNSGQRLAPLPASSENTGHGAASARRDASSAEAATGKARPSGGLRKSNWAAPPPIQHIKKTKSSTTCAKAQPKTKPVLAAGVPARDAQSDVLRIPTPTPVRGTESHATGPVSLPDGCPRTSSTPRRVSYTPYSVDDYHSMMEKVAHEKRGGLGPSDTDAQRQARERLERQRAYGKKATQHALEVLKAETENEPQENPRTLDTPSSPSTATEATAQRASRPAAQDQDDCLSSASEAIDEDADKDKSVHSRHASELSSATGTVSDAHAATGATKRTKRKVLRQPTPEHVTQARERRQRALEYAREKAAEAPKPPPQHRNSDTEGMACSGERGSAEQPRAPRADKATMEREQRRLDLEAKHAQQKLAVDHIRRQLRA